MKSSQNGTRMCPQLSQQKNLYSPKKVVRHTLRTKGFGASLLITCYPGRGIANYGGCVAGQYRPQSRPISAFIVYKTTRSRHKTPILGRKRAALRHKTNILCYSPNG